MFQRVRAQVVRMGLLETLSGWLGRGRVQAQVLVLGLDNAGKSTMLDALRAPAAPGQAPAAPPAPAAPTVALRHDEFHSSGVRFSACEVGGAARLRVLWERHYRSAHAVIFMVDAADHLRLVVAREELGLLLAHPDMRGRRVPLLVLANKCDEPLALPALQIAAALGLERVSERPWHVSACSVLSGVGLQEGLAWLAGQLRDAHRHA